MYFAGASQIECDKQGRILIPKYLKDYAVIRKDVMIIGVSNRIEIWSQEAWKLYYDNSKESFEDIAEKLMTEEGG
jgi:MraZ protein